MPSVIDCSFCLLFVVWKERRVKGSFGGGKLPYRDAEVPAKLLHHYRLSNYIIKSQWY